MGRALWIPDVCRQFGLVVIEVDGADDRGGSIFSPGGLVCHHTAGASTGDMPSLRVLIQGHSTLPGPLCNVGFSRSGIVYYIASGRANHAGRGGWRGLVGNSSVLGIEAENNGFQAWTPKQLELYPVLAAALMYGIRRGSEWTCGHKEWAPTRKPDPHTINMSAFRQKMTTIRPGGTPPAPSPAPPTPPTEFDMPFKPQPDAFHIGPAHSGLLWGLPGGGSRGDQVITTVGDGGLDQRWRRVPHADGTVSLVTRDGTLALDCPKPWENHSPAKVWDVHGGPEQRFVLESVPGSPYTHLVRHAASGLFVAPAGGGHVDAPLVLWTPVDGPWFHHRFTHTQ